MVTWGDTTDKGWTAVSRIFLRNYIAMGITYGEAMLVIHIIDFWWKEQLPFPKVSTLARLMGLNTRTVRLWISSLRKKGMVVTTNHAGRSNRYDFSPLFDKLRDIAGMNGAPVKATKAKSLGEQVAERRRKLKASMRAKLREAEKRKQRRLAAGAVVSAADAPAGEVLDGECPAEDAPKRLKPKLGSGKPSRTQRVREELKTGSLEQYISDRVALVKESPKVIDKQPNRHSSVFSHGDRKRSKSSKAKKRAKTSKPGQRKPSQYTAWDVERIFKEAWKATFSSPPAFWGGKERKQAKQLLEGYGGAVVEKVIRHIVTNWGTVKKAVRANGYPSISFIYGYRNTVFPMVLEEKAKVSDSPSWGTHYKTSEDREEGQEVGW